MKRPPNVRVHRSGSVDINMPGAAALMAGLGSQAAWVSEEPSPPLVGGYPPAPPLFAAPSMRPRSRSPARHWRPPGTASAAAARPMGFAREGAPSAAEVAAQQAALEFSALPSPLATPSAAAAAAAAADAASHVGELRLGAAIGRLRAALVTLDSSTAGVAAVEQHGAEVARDASSPQPTVSRGAAALPPSAFLPSPDGEPISLPVTLSPAQPAQPCPNPPCPGYFLRSRPLTHAPCVARFCHCSPFQNQQAPCSSGLLPLPARGMPARIRRSGLRSLLSRRCGRSSPI
jgi:hypothetical protein